MTAKEFEDILDTCCERLTAEARATGFKTSAQFENRVREVLRDLTAGNGAFIVYEVREKRLYTQQTNTPALLQYVIAFFGLLL